MLASAHVQVVVALLCSGVLLAPPPADAACTDNPGAAAFLADARAYVEARCPCAAATSRLTYRRCALAAARETVAASILPRRCRSTLLRTVSKSACGRPGHVTCCTPGPTSTKCGIAAAADCPAGAVGTTPSCFDACGPSCGNGLIESPEECDDENTEAGDGCSTACRIEAPAGCDAITVPTYVTAVATDPSYDIVSRIARDDGYVSPPLYPVRCTRGGTTSYAALLVPLNPSSREETNGAILLTVPDPESSFGTRLFRMTSDSRMHASAAVETMIGDAVADIVVVPHYVETNDPRLGNPPPLAYLGLHPDPCDLPTCKFAYDQHLDCVTAHRDGCGLCLLGAISCDQLTGKHWLARFLCFVAGPSLIDCGDCMRLLTTDCGQGPAGRSCQSINCRSGVCKVVKLPRRFQFQPDGYVYTAVGCLETGPSTCGVCETCEPGLCCVDVRNQPDRAVRAQVSRDEGYDLPGSCWANWGPPCGPNIPSCDIVWDVQVDYRTCSGGPALPWGFCGATQRYWRYQTCGMGCGSGLCDPDLVRAEAWAKIPACEDERGWDHMPPGPHSVGEQFWLIPGVSEACCPG